ncbi:toll-like receptor 8 [Stigmatopora argus]
MLPKFPCAVEVRNNSIIYDCVERKLENVPHGITTNATVLRLSENNINHIKSDSFSGLSNLTEIDLSWVNKNQFVQVDHNTFKNLSRLRVLKLSGDHLAAVPALLPLGLDFVDLTSNKIVSLNKNNFARLRKVNTLLLSKNCYYWNPCGKHLQIAEGTFGALRRLEKLDLGYNNLTEVPKGLPLSLHVLRLESNHIQYISEKDFRGMDKLKVLKMQGNCPRCSNAPYPCVPCKNYSLAIHPDAFQSLTQLRALSLGGNSLTSVNPSWFRNLTQLTELFVSFNLLHGEITGEAGFLTLLPKLEKIDLSFNFLMQLYPQTLKLSGNFSRLKSLQTLHLEGLVFREIASDSLQPLYELKNLSALNLGTNFIIYSDSKVFSKFPNLRLTYLAENRLFPTKVGVSAPSGEPSRWPWALANHHPQYFEITHSFVKQECYDSGRVLSLNANSLFFISPEQFEGYLNITCLNLSGNGFSQALNGTEFTSIPTLTYLDLSYNKVDLAYDDAFKELQDLQVLDISYNSHYFRSFGVTHNLHFLRNLPVLRVLNMSHNAISTLTTKHMHSESLSELQFRSNLLGNMWKVRDTSYLKLFSDLTNLTILDISDNRITKLPDEVYHFLPRNLTMLRLSNNLLKGFRWDKLNHFARLQILDLSFNQIADVTGMNFNATDTLLDLDLSHNQISQLDDGFLRGARSLLTLSLSYNKLSLINQSTFLTSPDSPIKNLLLGHNPFQCTCHMLDFILWIETSAVHIPHLTTDVTCDETGKPTNRVLIYFDINQCVNGSLAFWLCVVTSSLVCIFMLTAISAHLFYWDASYLLLYVKAKLRGYRSLKSDDNSYEVFVTYDTTDPQVSDWVLRNLRVQLEESGENCLPLCLEVRDWSPGVPLVDNLLRSIQRSRKTMFVLTEGYVKTGVFRLAMYLAHQRLLDENVDVIVLLMLEPVMQRSYLLRLRRRLCGRSVVEWPKTPAAEPWFWQNLRNVIRVDNQVMYSKTYTGYFTNRQFGQVSAGKQAGVCRYGRRLDCCYGWKRNPRGQCEAQCEPPCKHGECVGPNKCKCFLGYAGKTCNQDWNECGLIPRPCEHRCMNTHGSYKCYCLNGYTLMPDGSCANSRTCSLAHCQYGCEEVDGEIRCLCPSGGLQLAPDERTCVDIDECATGSNLCPYDRQCVNTFGSYFCKCRHGYDLKYVQGKYDCVDVDECASGGNKCSAQAVCLNTAGSYKCKCKSGFRGNGFECSAIPDSQLSPGLLDVPFGNEDIRNIIPEPVETPPPRLHMQPFDYDGEVYVDEPTAVTPVEELPEDEGDEDNLLNPRGDVFVSEDFESVFGPARGVQELGTTHHQEEFIMDCNFDQGACEWVQDKADDMDWTVAYHSRGGEYYMSMSGLHGEPEDVAKLKLLLSDRTQQGSFCLTFSYRVVGRNVGTLRVLLDNNSYPVWEQRHSRKQEWQTELLTVAWKEEAPQSIIFEAERGRALAGEIGLDNVVLTSGPCQDDDSPGF